MTIRLFHPSGLAPASATVDQWQPSVITTTVGQLIDLTTPDDGRAYRPDDLELTANTPSSCGEQHRCIWTIT